MMIEEFKGDYKFLCNFYEGKPFEYKGMWFTNSEAAFHSQKCLKRSKEFEGLKPKESKQLGRQVPLRPDWNDVRLEIMCEVCYAKFTQDKDLKKKLLETGDEYLQEGNFHRDAYWGRIWNDEKKAWIGDNNLGKILMKIREVLRND